jgi:citrate synthase
MARLDLGDKSIELPIIEGTEGEMAIDISLLRSTTGYITLDNGLGNTGSCQSEVTFLDGEEGILRYRGYSIEELCEKSSFLEVGYLLIYGELPTKDQLEVFRARTNTHANIRPRMRSLIETFPEDAHPMGVISSATVGLSAYYPEYLVPHLSDEKQADIFGFLMAKMPTIAAHYYRHSLGKKSIDSRKDLNYCEDFLNMMFGDPGYQANPSVIKALDVLFILHADHEQNCSASSVRVTGSGYANLFASLSAGMNALWGPLHGGANQAVIEMLDEIHRDGGDYKKFIVKAKDKNDTFRLMGFGHRVYKNFDPRSRIIKKACDDVLKSLGIDDPVLNIAKGLEEEVLKDSYFIERKLYPNVDFYSGIIYRALNIPTNMFTVMFVLGRIPGWIAQWREMIKDPKTRITRPRQIYMGHNLRSYVPMNLRK